MKIFKKGFTLIEVMIFLAISGALVAGIIISTNSVVDKQEYSGAVRNFVDLIQNAYGEVANPKNSEAEHGGRSKDEAIYGRLFTIGEKDSEGAMYSYMVVGKTNDQKASTIDDVLTLLENSKIDIRRANGSLYEESTKKPIWDVDIQNVDGGEFKGAILIVRSPASGVIYTFVLDANDNENRMINIQKDEIGLNTIRDGKKILREFEKKEISFCVSPKEKDIYGGNRYEVRLTHFTHDPAGVILLPFDNQNNRCGDES